MCLVNEVSPEMLTGGERAEGEKAKKENEKEVSETPGRRGADGISRTEGVLPGWIRHQSVVLNHAPFPLPNIC